MEINMLKSNNLYLISYAYIKNGVYGFGNTYKKDNEIQDIETLKEEIKLKNKSYYVVVLNIMNLSKI